MDKLSPPFCIVTICSVWMLWFTEAQLQIPRCIFSRLDVLPCETNIRTTLPGPNEQGIYRTEITTFRSGAFRCVYKDPLRYPAAQILAPINDLGNSNLRLIFSPGFILKEPYANAMIVRYNIKCPAGRLAFFIMTHLNLQPADCLDRCQDYIQVDRGEFGTTESCGTEPRDNMFQLEKDSFNITFRTSEKTQGQGFALCVICFDPEELDLPGCNRTEDTTIQFNFELLISELFGILSAENDISFTNPNPPTTMQLNNFISQEAIRHAILFENACNPVVRTTSEIVLQIATEQNATRLAEIRRLHNCHDSNATQISDIINEEAIHQAILNEFACNAAVRTTAEIILQIATDHNATRVEEIRKLLEAPPNLDFECLLLESGETIIVNCFVEDEAVSVGNCSIDKQQQFPCSLPIITNTAALTPGNHSITVSVTQNGLFRQDTVPFVVNRLSCHSNSGISGEFFEVTCTLNGNPLTQANCSFDSAAPEPCTLPLTLFEGHNVTISVTVDGQVLQATVTLQFEEK